MQSTHVHCLRLTRALQVVQCPSCGVCYKVTLKRQLLSLKKNKSSAVSVSPTTKFWIVLWALVSIIFLFGKCCAILAPTIQPLIVEQAA